MGAVRFVAERLDNTRRRKLVGWCLVAILLLLVIYHADQARLVDANAPVRLVLYGFSTQEEVLTQGIIPAFEAAWEGENGRDLIIESLFGPSGTLAGQINLGAPADVAVFSNAQHVNWLKVGRRVDRDSQPTVVSRTPMVIVVRPGNPFGVADFPDLARPGLRLLHADPHSSGAGEWAVLAEYGSAFTAGFRGSEQPPSGDQATAEGQLKAIWGNVRALAPSARAALTLYELGAGDALVTYEQDARLALERGVPLEIVVPARTILAEHVAVVVDDRVTAVERAAASELVRYLVSEAGQEILTRYHLRPALVDSAAFPPLLQPYTVEELGGWSRAHAVLIEELWENEIEPFLDLAPPLRLQDKGD